MLIVRMEARHVKAAAALRCEAFFAGSTRTIDEDAEGLAKIVAGDGFEAGFVCETEDQVVGTCLFVRHELDPAHDLTPWLAGLVVVPKVRKHGIGGWLVWAVEDHARSVGCSELHLYTDGAEPFYTKLGWTVADRFVTDGEPSVLMSRRL